MSGLQLRRPVHLLALGGGLGLAPWAPGTFGTLAALPIAAALAAAPAGVYPLATVAAIAAGVGICGRAAADAGVDDHPAIVWDEIAGFLVAALPLALGVQGVHPVVDGAVLFLLFRLFDGAKVGPIGWLDRHLHGGVGIMADDLAAGAATAAVWWAGTALIPAA
ncbi:MAG: phosphatidylglycerophosphatase A [Halorhodospira sp.]